MPNDQKPVSPPSAPASGDAAKPGVFSATIDVLGKTVSAVCDPVTKVCYPPLQAHWQRKYREPWPEKYARRMLILDFTLLTIIASLFVAGVFWNFLLPKPQAPGTVGVQAVAPGELVSGGDADFVVAYHNDSHAA